MSSCETKVKNEEPKVAKMKKEETEVAKVKNEEPEVAKMKKEETEEKMKKEKGDEAKLKKDEGDEAKLAKNGGDEAKLEKDRGDEPKLKKCEGEKPNLKKYEGDKLKLGKDEGDEPKSPVRKLFSKAWARLTPKKTVSVASGPSIPLPPNCLPPMTPARESSDDDDDGYATVGDPKAVSDGTGSATSRDLKNNFLDKSPEVETSGAGSSSRSAPSGLTAAEKNAKRLEEEAKKQLNTDMSQATATILIRLPNDQRLVGVFNCTHTFEAVRNFICNARPELNYSPFQLMRADLGSVEVVDDLSQTLEDAHLSSLIVDKLPE